MRDAREKFHKGDRVKYSEIARRELFRRERRESADRIGVVVGFSHQPELVAVVWDGTKTRQTYHMAFIDVDGAPR